MMLKAVFWDMDGTLIDSEPYWHAGEMQIAHENGGVWNDELAWNGSGRPVPDVAREIATGGRSDLHPCVQRVRLRAAGGGDRPAHDRIRDAGGI